MQNGFSCYKMLVLWSESANEAILEQVKAFELDYHYASNSLETKAMHTKLIPETFH